jgi:hypothetical protein
VIFTSRRFFLPLAAFAVLLAGTGAPSAQVLPVAQPSVLPEEPRPQNIAQNTAQISAQITAQISATMQSGAPTTLLAEAYSSSETLPGTTTPQTTSTQQTPATQTPQPPLTEEQKRQEAEVQLQRELHQRMAGVVPNFNAVLGGNALPLSPSQKMRAAFRSAIDPYQFGLALITSGYGQATDSHSSVDSPSGNHHGYPQGWAGYGCRYGANYVDQFDGTIIGNGILPVLLHQDARYFRMGTGSFTKRFFYSLSTTVVAHGDSGKLQPNYSNVLGNLVSGGISNLYYPRSERGFALTIEQGLTVTAEGSFGALLIEFYPDIRKHIHGKRPPQP